MYSTKGLLWSLCRITYTKINMLYEKEKMKGKRTFVWVYFFICLQFVGAQRGSRLWLEPTMASYYSLHITWNRRKLCLSQTLPMKQLKVLWYMSSSEVDNKIVLDCLQFEMIPVFSLLLFNYVISCHFDVGWFIISQFPENPFYASFCFFVLLFNPKSSSMAE